MSKPNTNGNQQTRLPRSLTKWTAIGMALALGLILYRLGASLSLMLAPYSAYSNQWQVSYAVAFVIGMAYPLLLIAVKSGGVRS